MNNLVKILSSSTLKDHDIQMSLLEVEFPVLAKALVGLSDSQRKIFFRNTTYSAKKQLSKMLASYHELEEEEIASAQEALAEIINKNQLQASPIEMPNIRDTKPVRVETRNKHEIFASLLDISQLVQKEGLPSLENTMHAINEKYLENFVLKKGLEYILTGRDPKTSQALMDNLKKAMLKNIEEHLNMILEGIEQIHKGHSTKELVRILKNYL